MKKIQKTLCLLLATVIIIGIVPISISATTSTISVKVEKYITDAIYDDVKDFSEGYAAICKDGKWGYIDENGKEVIEPVLYKAFSFSGKTALVIVNTEEAGFHANYITKSSLKNKDCTSPMWIVSHYSLGNIFTNTFINNPDNITVNAKNNIFVVNDFAYKFDEQTGKFIGAIAVKSSNKLNENIVYDYAIANTGYSYDNIISMQAWTFNDSNTPCVPKCFFIDTDGNIIKQFPVNSSALIYVSEKDYKSGNYTPPDEYTILKVRGPDSECFGVTVGYVVALDNGSMYLHSTSCGIMDTNYEWIVQPNQEINGILYKLDDGSIVNDGLITIINSNGKYGAINTEGKTVIPNEYDYLGYFHNGFAYAEKDGKMYYVDKNNNRYNAPSLSGEKLIESDAGVYGEFSEKGIAGIKDNKSGKYYLISNNSTNNVFEIIEGSDKINLADTYVDSNGIATYKKNGKIGFMKLSLTYTDAKETPSSWATEEVNAAIAVGLVPEEMQKGYTNPISRGDVAQIFINLIEKVSGKSIDDFMDGKGVKINNNAFKDTTDKAVLAANALGIINGTSEGKFSPNSTLTRAQIAAIINRVAKVMGITTSGYKHNFTDIIGNNTWVYEELGWPVHVGIIQGVGGTLFKPEGQLTTEQAILITYRALNALKNQ